MWTATGYDDTVGLHYCLRLSPAGCMHVHEWDEGHDAVGRQGDIRVDQLEQPGGVRVPVLLRRVRQRGHHREPGKKAKTK